MPRSKNPERIGQEERRRERGCTYRTLFLYDSSDFLGVFFLREGKVRAVDSG